MSEPTDDITKEYVEGCGLIYDEYGIGEAIGQERIRVMSPFEIKQRAELNVANTASALRAKVLAASNGNSLLTHVDSTHFRKTFIVPEREET